MNRTLGAVGLGLCLMWVPSPAHAVTGALCIKDTLNGSLKLRATGICKSSEIQIGSFDGTTLQFSGINVQIVSGAGSTNAPVNGKGNLIVGYNANSGGHARSGSHNLIVGDEHTYSSFGGLVAGSTNSITAPSASVSGGRNNTASGFDASVSGGEYNTASGSDASVSGGNDNSATGGDASVSGGARNTASGSDASVSGGDTNTAGGTISSISGGALLSQPVYDGWAAGSKGSPPGNVVVGNFESP